MIENKKFSNIIPIHPSQNVKHIMEALQMSEDEFMNASNIPSQEFKMLMKCDIGITANIAKNLAGLLNVSSNVWTDLQKNYEIQIEKQFDEEKCLLEKVKYSYFVNLKVVENIKDKLIQYIKLLNFFSIPKLSILLQGNDSISFRSASKTRVDPFCANTWVRTAAVMADGMGVMAYQNGKLETYIPEIRQMTLQKPTEFLPRLRTIFKQCGVAFVLLPPIPTAGVNGAVKWIGNEKVLLAINNHGKDADKFWFALFHEIKHILQKEQGKTFISFTKNVNDDYDKLEIEADDFSRKSLIPEIDYNRFSSNSKLDESSIVKFAQDIKIDKGIVVGRLQHDKKIGYNQYNDLKTKYDIVYK